MSDIGAMGAEPLCALVAAGRPAPDRPRRTALAQGVAEASAAFDCPVGGDLTSASQVVVSVAVTGVLDGDRPPLTRAGARPGDHLMVTGPLGGSSTGPGCCGPARGRRPGSRPGGRPPTAPGPPGRRPGGSPAAGVSAMVDVSDGLALDLHRLADASGWAWSRGTSLRPRRRPTKPRGRKVRTTS